MKTMFKLFSILCLSITLIACGGANTDTSEQDATKVIDDYFNALHEGDVEKAMTYCSDSVKDQLSEITDGLDSLSTVLGDNNNDDELIGKYNEIVKMTVKSIFEKHEITQVDKVSDTEYDIAVKNTGIKTEELTKLSEELDFDSFMDGIMTEFTQLYMDEGEEAALKWLMNEVGTHLFEKMNDFLKNAPRKDSEIHCIVIKDGDHWIINEMK